MIMYQTLDCNYLVSTASSQTWCVVSVEMANLKPSVNQRLKDMESKINNMAAWMELIYNDNLKLALRIEELEEKDEPRIIVWPQRRTKKEIGETYGEKEMKKLFYVGVTLSVLINILLVTMMVLFAPPAPPEVPDLYFGFFEWEFAGGGEGLCVAEEDIDLFKTWLYEINEKYY